MNAARRGLSHFRASDLFLAALVIAILAMMVVPLPVGLLDLLIALNLTLGVLLLSSALYVREPLSLSAFPTLLLLSTLYRLALNVSSTRLILLQADAGQVIEAFGKFVVRGDYLVGAMVFVILTLIQFIVIARGAERVAEVGARFSLDALPGKQLAIDAEQRAGSLSAESARRSRRRLERESQLYGALDGSMKFIKGDAIAGILITLVNFVGGVAIGVASRGLSLSDSLTTYGLLTIGDGLVTQIPALLGATAAGLVVTRVGSDDSLSLTHDIQRQLLTDRRVLLLASIVLVALALLPGLPAWPFAVSALLLGVAWFKTRSPDNEQPAPHIPPSPRAPFELELSTSCREPFVIRGQATAALARALEANRQAIAQDLGVPVPSPAVRLNPSLLQGQYRWVWRELPEPSATLPAEVEVLALGLQTVVRRHAGDCLGLEEVQSMLDLLEREKPALVRHTVPKLLSPALLAQVLRELVREGVSVRWLPDVLEALAVHAPSVHGPSVHGPSVHAPLTSASVPRLVEEVRAALSRRISQTLAPAGMLHVLRLSGLLEETVADAVRQEGLKEWLALPTPLARDITESIRSAWSTAPQPCVLLTQATLRKHVRTLLEQEDLELPVVSPRELEFHLTLTHGAPIGP